MNKVQVSINEEHLATAKRHPLFRPGKGAGQGVVGLLNFALSWALADSQIEALTAYEASFKLEALRAKQAEIEREIAALSAPPSAAKKAVKK